MYKLIAIDMDGTLLKEDKTISEYTKKIIEQARKIGVKIVLASGRPLEGLEAYLDMLGLVSEEDYVICYNGAIVQNVATKEVVGRTVLTGIDLKKLYEVSKELEVSIHAFSKEGCITPIMTKYSQLEGDINDIPVKVMDYSQVTDEEEIIKIMLVDEPKVLQKAVDRLPKKLYSEYTVVRSAPYFLEFLDKKVNKGEGVRALAEHLNIKKEEIMCFGDAGNDWHMIEFAGMGVAMGNAFPEVKEIANYITKTNEEDGVAYAIEKFVL
ncbi:MAG: sugar-phosphatase [Cellulosilyticaceae bacterium]